MTHTINIPPLRKALEHVTEHPEEHNQGTWASRTGCGTTGCLAYWIATFAGHKVAWMRPLIGVELACFTTQDKPIGQVAAREAGLSPAQAKQLFNGNNTIDDLWNLASEYTDGEIARPHDSSSPAAS